MNPVNDFGIWWLSGAKYDLSERLAGDAWDIPVSQALAERGRTLNGCSCLRDVFDVFAGHEFWKRDGWYALQDTVLPPALLLSNGGDDCDGWAMTHAQAINQALGILNYKATIITYLADPWWMSHHFVLAEDSIGQFWAMQPQYDEATYKAGITPGIYGPFESPEKAVEKAVEYIARCYNSKVVWWDQRDDKYRPLG